MRSLIVAVLAAIASSAAAQTQPAAVPLRFDPSITYQTIEGWGGTLRVERGSPFKAWMADPTLKVYDDNPVKDPWPRETVQRMIADAVLELGLNRWRIELGPQVEIENDNDDPSVADEKAYRFTWQDIVIENEVLPIKRLLETRGEKLVLYISYDLASKLTKPFLLKPGEYAEMAEVFARHMKTKFGLEADYWSVQNEPGNGRPMGSAKLYAQITAATGARLAKAGFKTKMSGPECVHMDQIPALMDAFAKTPGALDHFGLITYHLYQQADSAPLRQAIADWSKKLKVPCAQTEWLEDRDLNVARHIQLCLTVSNVISWERYGWLSLYAMDKKTFATTRVSSTWYVRQFCRYIRPGAVRVQMASPDEKIHPAAFLSPGKKPVVVLVNSDKVARPVTIAGLPGGEYQAISTFGKTLGKEQSVKVEAGRPYEAALPAQSVLTLTADPPPPVPTTSPATTGPGK